MNMLPRNWFGWLAGSLLLGAMVGCRPAAEGVCVEGSDTMVNLAQGWAENYHATHPEAMIQVSGGGTGVGIASLVDGNCEIASASRKMKEKENERVREKRHMEPIEHVVGYDALAVYVHKDNPLESISIEELAEIYGQGGRITCWSQLGVEPKLLRNDTIIRISRQNSSGTYVYFREAVMGKTRDYKLGSIDQNGSVDVVALVANTPSAIGYSGMGYSLPGVKMLKISKHKGVPGIAPTVENAKKKKNEGGYPITRPLLLYTVGQPKEKAKQFLDWILDKPGQKVVVELGYVPVAPYE
ncbi:MAG: phosphate ABC transporter substrate-binding protein [Planctomycetota bacterium]